MYGYEIKDGKALIVEQEAESIRQLFENYLSGMSLDNAAKNAGIPLFHSAVKNMIQRRYYAGDDFYPAIVDKKIFNRANEELIRRASGHSSGRILKTPPVFKDFVMSVPTTQYDDPIKQAEYLYSLIEVKK